LATAHNGDITVESNLKTGTVFTLSVIVETAEFKYPRIIEDEPSNNEYLTEKDLIIENSIDKNEEKENLTVLIVEDNNELRNYIKEQIRPKYKTILAKNGGEGINKAFEYIPDIIVSDVMMPVMTGHELTKRLKADKRTSHIPIILLTAKASPDNRIEALSLGADCYLTKPFEPQELMLYINNFLKARKKIQGQFKKVDEEKVSKVNISEVDRLFMLNLKKIISDEMNDSDFSVATLSEKIAMSESNLFRKIKALTNLNTRKFILLERLLKADELLRSKSGSISEIAYQVGFKNTSHFASSFKKEFGKSPSQVI
jgi:DNA-binding response OmpR family regulator